MIINLTLIVQMCHFAVAYYMLKILFLRPAVDLILKQDVQKKLVHESVDKQQKELAHQEEARRLQWRYLQRLLQVEKPVVGGVKIPFSLPVLQSWQSIIQKNQLQTMTQEVKDALVERLSHD